MSTYYNFRKDTPVACHRVSFKGNYTHYTALVDDESFKNFPGNVVTGHHPRDFLFKDMVTTIRKHTGDDFYLNEYVHATEVPISHCLYLDIDIADFLGVNDVENALDELVNGRVSVKVSRNEESGKVHMVTNILIDSDEQKQITRYLAEYLYDYVDHLYTREEWNNGFDGNACGLRSIYSIKITDTVKSRARYIPDEPEPKTTEQFADLLWKYSIYNITDTVNFTEAARDDIVQCLLNHKIHTHAADEELIVKNQTLPLFGRAYKIDQKLIDNLVQCLGPEWKNAKKWWVVLAFVRNASQFIPDFDPNYFLKDWSAGGDGFNLEDNIKRFANYRPRPDQLGSALAFLRGAACKSNYRLLRRLLFPVPPIMDPENKTHLMDYDKIPQCPPEDAGHPEKYKRLIREFVHETIAMVINGGQSMWVTKNIIEGEIEYKMVKCESSAEKNFNHNFSFIIDWVEYDPAAKKKKVKKTDVEADVVEVKLGEKTLRPRITTLFAEMIAIRRDISYSRIDFVPYIRARGWDNTERVFNQFTGLISDHEYVPRSQSEYETDLKDILYHLREVLCAGDDASYQYILRWLAHIVQRPEDKIGVCCIVRSQEGAGKTSFWEWFGKYVLGSKYYLPARMDRVVKKFNSITANNLFTVFEETKNGEGMKNHEDIKQMITDEVQVIEPKGLNSYKTKSYTNYVILTNEHYPVKLTANDRRFMCLEADNKHKSDRAYWVNLLRQFKNEGATYGELFFEYLHTFDISDWNPYPIITNLRRDLKMNSLPFSIQFLIEIARGNIPELVWGDQPLQVHTDTLYNYFKRWETETDVKIKTTQMSFSKTINEVRPSEKFELILLGKKKRGMGFIYTRQELIESLRTYLNDPEFTVDIETENDTDSNANDSFDI